MNKIVVVVGYDFANTVRSQVQVFSRKLNCLKAGPNLHYNSQLVLSEPYSSHLPSKSDRIRKNMPGHEVIRKDEGFVKD